MASLTYWNRLEPRPRSTSIARALAAHVRDPAWTLARQWQVGEFQGEDAASPAVVETLFRLSSLGGWRPQEGELRPLQPAAPLEPALEGEGRSLDLAVRVELGQVFESLLVEADLDGLRDDFRDAYPVTPLDEVELARMADEATARFLRVCGGRAIDGIALLEAADLARPLLPDDPPVPPGAENAVLGALDALRRWADDVLGARDAFDPPAWNPKHLEYSLDVLATLPTGSAAALAVTPRHDGALDWSSFDLRPGTTGDAGPTGPVENVRTSVLPTQVRFPGMPNARWWSFEDGRVDFGGVQPDLRDLGRLMLIDFALIHGNDWFVLPFEQPVGSLCGIEALVVHDVFGGATLVPRADQSEASPDVRWTMFSTASAGGGLPADFFLLPAAAVPAAQPGGPVLEEVQLIRDEMANIAWAIERVVENGLGEPWPGHERELAIRERQLPAPPADDEGPALSYLIQTTMPEHWIPLLPVMLDPARGDIALELGALLRGNAPDGDPILPLGRILRPPLPDGRPYRIPEHEVSRSGTKATRQVFRTRWIDGSTHLWIARVKSSGRGEGTSGLRFDLATSD